MFSDEKINEIKTEIEFSDSFFSDSVKIENEDVNEEESFMEQSLPQFSYTLDLSFHHNTPEEVSCEMKPTLEYLKLNGDNSVVTNSDSPWDLASKTFPRSLERILNNCGVRKAKNTKNLITPEMNIKKKALVDNKNVNLINDGKTNKLKDKYISETNQFAKEVTSESDVLKKYKKKTKPLTDVEILQNKYGNSENNIKKNVVCLSAESVEEDKSEKQIINKGKREKLEGISIFDTPKVQGCQKKKRSQLLQGSFSSDNSELDHLAENGPTIYSKNKKKYEQSEDIISDSQNEFIPLIQESESLIGKIKRKKNKKLGEKITDKVSNKCVPVDEENLTEKSERNSKHELSGDSMISVDKNTFVDLVEHEKYNAKRNKRKKHIELKDNVKHKQHEENISYVNKNELAQFNEVSDSHTQKNKKKKHKELEEKLVNIDKNQFLHLDKKNENLEEKSNKKRKHEQFGNGVLCIDNDQVVNLEYDENLSKKSKRKKCTQYEESILNVDKNGLIQLNEGGGSYAGEKKKKKQKEVEKKLDYIDKNKIVHLDEENENLTEKRNENHDQSGDEIEYVHFAEENIAKEPKSKKGRQLEENEIVMEKGITVKEHKQPAQSISYVENEFFQSNEGDTYTRKNKRRKHKELKEKIGYIDNNQFIHLAEENENLTEKRKSNKENNLEQPADGIPCIDKNELTNLDKESEYFIKKTKKKKYRQLEENEIVMEKRQKKKQNKPFEESISYVSENESVQLNEKSKFHVGESKKKKQMELQETITHVDNNQFFHLGEENENLTTKMEKDKHAQLEQNISSIDDSKFLDLVEQYESVIGLSQKIPGQFEENDYLLPTIDSNEFIDLGEVNESLDKKNEKEQHKKLEEDISNVDNNELLHLNGENESIKHKTKKKTRRKPLEESISDNDKSQLMNIVDKNIFSPISEKEKRSKRKISDKSKKKLDNVNIVKDVMIDDEEDIFSGIFKSESSRETIIENVVSGNTPPLLKKNNNSSRNRSNKEKEDSFVMKEELSNNLADNVVRRNIKNSPHDNPKAESYTFSDILSQTNSDKLMQKFNDIVNKSIEEKSCSDPSPSPRSSKHVSKSQLKQRSMHDFVKPKIDLEEHQKKLKIIDLLNESKTIEDIREELEMPIITEQRKEVEGLVIETDWPIAPIHRIAYFVNSCPTAGQKRALKEAGITWKLGKYTKEEDERIMQNWANFCKVHNWNEENYQPFLKCSTKTNIGILNQLQRRKFAHYISRGFDNRLLYSVYHRFQRLFLENEANSGRFTEEDDKIILEYVNSGNSSQPFAELVDLLKRSRLALIKRYRFIEMKDKRKDERVLWNKELTEKLLANLIEVTRSVKLSELKNYNITVREWKKVSKLMNIPADKLKRAWKLSLYPRFFSQNYVTEITEVKKELVDLLYIKYNDWREVNWDEVAEQLGNKFSGPKLCKVMRDLIINKVPPKKRDNLHHALKYMRQHYQNWGVTKNRLKFVDDILEETRNVTIIPKIVNKSAHEKKSPIRCGSTSKKRTK
ncbi:hypothetical protein WA026_014750 [Henosepilachna vigintioctopunctata]|uniref:Uncharacterized protein n=1 Tax=Henosepilachna vigintioctopunctata TaxID=420089 RepID=A0AAW1V865_9CUCU